MIPILEMFGEQVKMLRSERGLTQKQLAEEIGVTQSVIGKYERGLAYPTVDKLMRLSAKLGASADTLLGFPLRNRRTIEVDVEDLSPAQVEWLLKVIQLIKSGLNA